MRIDARLLTTAAIALPRALPPQLNLLGDIFNEQLKAQKPYERPLLPSLVKSKARSYYLQEKMLSFSGEDFRVRDLEGNEIVTIDVRLPPPRALACPLLGTDCVFRVLRRPGTGWQHQPWRIRARQACLQRDVNRPEILLSRAASPRGQHLLRHLLTQRRSACKG